MTTTSAVRQQRDVTGSVVPEQGAAAATGRDKNVWSLMEGGNLKDRPDIWLVVVTTILGMAIVDL